MTGTDFVLEELERLESLNQRRFLKTFEHANAREITIISGWLPIRGSRQRRRRRLRSFTPQLGALA